jgi:predicted restriction endonuclease
MECLICGINLNRGKKYCSHKCYGISIKNRISPMKGRKHSEETKQKMKLSAHRGEDNQAKRPEVREKISKSKTGLKFSDEHCSNISKTHKGKHYSIQTEFQKGHTLNCGAKNYFWKGGISFLPYAPEFNQKLKEKVRKRDNYQCQECGKTQEQEIIDEKHKLHIHHIDSNKKNNNIDNLISLCNRCHGKKKRK